MCTYTAIYRNTEISFLDENVYQEDGRIIINHPINSDHFDDKSVPKKIPLKDLQMTQEQRNHIEARFAKVKAEKEKAKTRKVRAAVRQL
jgi:hypothetical protein